MRFDRRFLVALTCGGLVALYGGLRFAGFREAPPRHRLTGRPVAGMATNAAWMDRAEREQEEQPDRALDLMDIGPGVTVADIGAGSGYMTVRLARRVAPTGRVYATDVQQALLQLLTDKVRREALDNVTVTRGRDDDAGLPDGVIDVALMVDVYHELRRPGEMLQSLRRALVANGRLILLEYRGEDASLPIAATHRMSVADARIEIEATGFTLERVNEDLPRQHLLVFRCRAGACGAVSRSSPGQGRP